MTEYIPITEDKGVAKKILEIGTGPTPIEHERVSLHYEAYIDSNDTKFDSSYDRNTYFEFILGEGKVIEGWEYAIKSMKVGETAEIICTSNYAYGKKGYSSIIPPDTTLKFKITLLSTEESTDSISYRIKKATDLKSKGNEVFKEGNYEDALKLYVQGSEKVKNLSSSDNKEMDQLNQILVTLLLNMGMCCLKLKNPNKTIEYCEKVIDLDNGNVKAYYRLGQAYSEINDHEEAIRYVKLGLKVVKQNKE
ncbi:hypothetical protein BJ944DRAFT_259228 [Cunninghamella echinulata]|nr:hypothetical protein BJ944DRAFT_259228 [Cunninghamella echinulata]